MDEELKWKIKVIEMDKEERFEEDIMGFEEEDN
jgi:hypothetical protein